MNRLKLSVAALAAAATVALTVAAPVVAQSAAMTGTTASAGTAKEYFVVLPEDGRYYAFGDLKTYFSYLAHGEVALTRSKIGVGPTGNTVVFGITADDVKNNTPSLGEQVFEGKLSGGADFYGEVFKDGRYYVFDDLKDLLAFAAFGEVPYSYTDIGTGPKGESLVWVMNKDSYAKGRPTGRIDRFKAIRAQ